MNPLAAAVVSAAAVILLAGGASTAFYLVRHDHHAASRHSTAAVAASKAPTEPASPAPVAAASPSPSATPSPTPTPTTAPSPSPSPSSSPPPSPGTLDILTPQPVQLQQTPGAAIYTGSFAISAAGGPVTYSISEPADKRVYYTITVDPPSGTLQSGKQQTIQVSVTQNPTLAGGGPAEVTVTSGQTSQTVTFSLVQPIQ